MATKIVLTVEEGLSKQEIEDLRYLLTDALGEFAARRTPARDYVDGRYTTDTYAGAHRECKVQQVERRNALAKKMHDAALHFQTESVEPHCPTPVFEYYSSCGDDDKAAMSAALDLLPAADFPGGERKGWVVQREEGLLVLEGPDGERAFWHEIGQRWMWLEEPKAVAS